MEGVVIQVSYRGDEHKFYFSREKNVYFNIRRKNNVIQTSLRGEQCNLLIKYRFDLLPFNKIV